MNHMLAIFLFFLPAGVANAAPVCANKIPRLNDWKTPLDFGKSFQGKRIFGENKTWRGLTVGTVAGVLTGAVIQAIFPQLLGELISVPSTMIVNMAFIGGILGFGALAGDAIESFFKRQIGVKPGNSWFPLDQTDYIIGGLIAVYPIVPLPFKDIVIVFIMYFGLHLLVSYIGYHLKLKDKPI